MTRFNSTRQNKFNSRTAAGPDPVYISRQTLNRLRKEHQTLTTEGRRQAAEMKEAAAALGDRSESGDYDAAKKFKADLERRISRLEGALGNFVLTGETRKPGHVNIGDVVHLQFDGESAPNRYLVASPEELMGSDTNSEELSVLSPNAPSGQALIGKKIGEEPEWHNNLGQRVRARITHIESRGLHDEDDENVETGALGSVEDSKAIPSSKSSEEFVPPSIPKDDAEPTTRRKAYDWRTRFTPYEES